MDLPDNKPLPTTDDEVLTPVQRRARRRRLSRRAMTAVTWSLVLASGLLVLQRQQSQAASVRAAPHEAQAQAVRAHEHPPSLHSERSVRLHSDAGAGGTDLAGERVADAVQLAGCGESGLECPATGRGVPLKPSDTLPSGGNDRMHVPDSASSAGSGLADAAPLRIDPAEPGAPAVSAECRQVAEEIQSIAAALRDAVDPVMREGLQRRGREADNRQFFLHCLS